MCTVEQFQERFRAWLGSDPERGIKVLARKSGYSEKYIAWAAGLIGRKPWPGSRRFVRKMQRLGCGVPWRDRPAEQIALAFEQREELVGGAAGGGREDDDGIR
jgi:hypothetical protein